MNAEIRKDSAHVERDGPGASLRQARERAGMSVDELGSRTRLSRQTLEAMEADAYDQLLEPVYVRGYYRKCARILNLPEQPLIDAYEASYTPPPITAPERLRLASGGELGSVPRVSRRFAVLSAIAAIILCAVIWLLRDGALDVPGGSNRVSIDPVDPSSAMPDAGAVTAGVGLILDTDLPAVEPAPAVTPADGTATAAGSAPAEGAAATDPAAVVTTAVAPPPAAGTQLVLVFEAISWARVEDAGGNTLLSGVIGEGERRALDGRPPYTVFLGNAPGVKVEFGGQPFATAPFMKSNSTARFSVPATGG